MANKAIRIGFVPEHYLLPLHLCTKHSLFPSNLQISLVPFPSGTGHMITSLRSKEIDLAIGLTEGWVAGLLNPDNHKKSAQEKGYSIVGSWVSTPLRWAIVTGRNRDDISTVDDLKQHRRVGVSRLGSGSHIMAFVLAQQEGWLHQSKDQKSEGLTLVPLGPFKDLRDGVTSSAADFFMWEHFTTKPWFHGEGTELKKIGEIYTPWPSWHIAASTEMFPNPEGDETLKAVFEAFDQGIKAFSDDTGSAIRMLGTGEAQCHYSEDDGKEWLKGVKFVDGTRGVDEDVMKGVVDVLKTADVIGTDVQVQRGDGVIGIAR
ncbi:alpha 1,3-glucosidase [Cladophialophora yegresii CBS 114405]|uniref:Alpha 1,3-glucosidase n=1 Tax=Cladophialophora yegresii CBS 114405 TaxID=1182544 RepID=W9W8M7_9EURO|nr:alpha 1,3-glucosidase [Cladophialophora yegresii CBS 114405]EXJ60871.1 alpha 1,3-glucosidase [Cladophialophora yegresii CBS 114405]